MKCEKRGLDGGRWWRGLRGKHRAIGMMSISHICHREMLQRHELYVSIWLKDVSIPQTTLCSAAHAAAPQPHHGVLLGVVLRDGDVVVGHLGSVCCRLLGVPHDVVQVGEVVIQVDSFKAVASVGPAGQFWALQHINRPEAGASNHSWTFVIYWLTVWCCSVSWAEDSLSFSLWRIQPDRKQETVSAVLLSGEYSSALDQWMEADVTDVATVESPDHLFVGIRSVMWNSPECRSVDLRLKSCLYCSSTPETVDNPNQTGAKTNIMFNKL